MIYRIRPGQPVPKLGPGDTALLDDGDHGPLRLVRARGWQEKPVTLRALNRGAAVVSGGEAPDGALLVRECAWLTVEGLRIERSRGRGVRASDSFALTLRGLEIRGVRMDGILTGFCSRLTVERCLVDGEEQREFEGKTPHGIYVSCSSEEVRLLENSARSCSGCAIQMNGNADERSRAGSPFTGWVRRAEVRGNQGLDCGRHGAAGFNLERVRDSRFIENLLVWSPDWEWDSAGGIAVYGGSRGLLFESCSVEFPPGRGRYGVQVAAGCEATLKRCRIVCGRGAPLVAQGRVEQEGCILARRDPTSWPELAR